MTLVVRAGRRLPTARMEADVTIVLCLALCAFPVLVVRVIHRGVPGFGALAEALQARHHRPAPGRRTDFSQDLGRLLASHHDLRAAGFEGADQLLAVEHAYDQVLRDAGRAMSLDGFDDIEEIDALTRLRLESELLGRGLHW